MTDGRFTSHALGLSVVFLAFVSCLPADTRPVPASLDVTVTADPLLLGGSTGAPTVDGWTVSYDRFLLSLGGASLDGDTSCGMYYMGGLRIQDREINLTGHEAAVVDLRVRGDTLFLDSLEPTRQALRFDAIAAADDKYGNGDGDVSLAELGLVPLPDIDTNHRYAEPAALDGGISTWRSLEDYVYLGLFPEVVRFERDGSCAVTVGDHRR